MFSFLLGLVAAFALAIYKPEWFAYVKEQIAGVFTKAGVDVPGDKDQ